MRRIGGITPEAADGDASDATGTWVPLVAAGAPFEPVHLSTGSPALAGTALATIKGWGAVRLAMQARARASRFTAKLRKFNQIHSEQAQERRYDSILRCRETGR